MFFVQQKFFFFQGEFILALLKCGFQITAVGED